MGISLIREELREDYGVGGAWEPHLDTQLRCYSMHALFRYVASQPHHHFIEILDRGKSWKSDMQKYHPRVDFYQSDA